VTIWEGKDLEEEVRVAIQSSFHLSFCCNLNLEVGSPFR
ncbi:hypothetical protein A2U01_0046562, partial [Trifolium medium]|nr:hypothetical protein [Trifolium medium]